MDKLLDAPIIQFNEEDTISFRDLTRGTFITGGTGSGKSSGSGALLRNQFLRLGMGGLVLCVKEDEYHEWKKAVFQADRQDDFVVFSPKNNWRFNFLDYEMNRADGGGEIFNIVNLFMNIYQMGQEEKSSKGEDRFWDSALKRLLNMAVSTIKLAGEKLTIEHMYDVVSSAPSNKEEVDDETWMKNSDCFYCVAKAKNDKSLNLSEENKLELEEIERFWFKQFADLDERTRSNIIESFLGLIDPFRRGLLKKLLCEETNCSPEIIFKNKIVILNVPVTKYLQLGVYVQSIYKLIFQQAAERRIVKEDTLPVFLWVDEAQKTLTQQDALFLTTARSSRVATVFITQNISNFYATIGGKHPIHLTNSLLANLCVKFFHANNEHVTNKYAADIIGKSKVKEFNYNYSGMQDKDEGLKIGGSESTTHYHQVFPVEFTTLKTGGGINDYIVECFVTITGKIWSNGKNHRKLSINQK